MQDATEARISDRGGRASRKGVTSAASSADLGSSNRATSVGRVYLLQSFANYDSRELSLQAVASTEDVRDATLEVQRQSEALRISIFMEPTDALEKTGLHEGLLDFSPQGDGERPVYELRTYQLKLGYTTVPSFVEKYTTGLKDKLEADQTGQSQLVTLMYSESGAAPLNTVHELWRHRSMKGSQESRQASRAASGWKQAIAEIADLAITFHSQYLRPIPGIGVNLTIFRSDREVRHSETKWVTLGQARPLKNRGRG
eukprot:s565_g19.t2